MYRLNDIECSRIRARVRRESGTPGAGIDLSVALTSTINARISVTRVEVDDQTDTITIGDPGFEGDLNATVNLGGNNNLVQADLDDAIQAAEADINDELAILKAWPVISIGFNYAF